MTEAAQDAGRRCLDGAGIRYEEHSQWSSLVKPQPIDGLERVGSSTWQSVQRGGSTETAYLNGEIAMIARRTGTRAPINSELQRLVAARRPARPDTLGSYDEQEVLARCRTAGRPSPPDSRGRPRVRTPAGTGPGTAGAS